MSHAVQQHLEEIAARIPGGQPVLDRARARAARAAEIAGGTVQAASAARCADPIAPVRIASASTVPRVVPATGAIRSTAATSSVPANRITTPGARVAEPLTSFRSVAPGTTTGAGR